ncbi:MAG: hypothetical protein BRD50_08525 [Bacteroidetes bacterium SW_11_45_7]|nr:MAG: hypothetical protein BRD50_08525 [Bacteroidetes bacterium SW_11_45_7]
MDASNKIVHGMWIGQELSKIELLTLHSFTRHGHIFYLWAYDDITTLLPDGVVIKNANEIIPQEQVFSYNETDQFGHGKGSYAGFSDVFRYKLLYKYGGWWVDMDICCLKPFDIRALYVFREHHDYPAVGNMMKCPPGSEVMKCSYEQAVQEVHENNADWHKPLDILNRNIQEQNLLAFVRPMSNIDDWYEVNKYFRKRQAISPDWYALHFVNEMLRINNIDKNGVKWNSEVGRLLREYGLMEENISWKQLIKEEWEYSWLYFKTKQVGKEIMYKFGVNVRSF